MEDYDFDLAMLVAFLTLSDEDLHNISSALGGIAVTLQHTGVHATINLSDCKLDRAKIQYALNVWGFKATFKGDLALISRDVRGLLYARLL